MMDQFNERTQAIADLGATLPEDKDWLHNEARDAVKALHTAVLAGDGAGRLLAGRRYDAAIWRLNGNTLFGCNANHDSAGLQIVRYCAAVPGSEPMWGQSGEFIIESRGIRVLVRVITSLGGLMTASYEFHVVDLDRPFISETGFRADYARLEQVVLGCYPADLAREIVDKYQRCSLTPRYRELVAAAPLPSWCDAMIPRPVRTPAVEQLPRGFVRIDVVLPDHQAFIVQRWAEQAKTQVAAIATAAPAIAPGMRCVVVDRPGRSTTPFCGKRVVVTKVCQESRQAWAHEDRPISYRVNRAGRRVVDSDPSCIQTLYSFDELCILSG